MLPVVSANHYKKIKIIYKTHSTSTHILIHVYACTVYGLKKKEILHNFLFKLKQV